MIYIQCDFQSKQTSFSDFEKLEIAKSMGLPGAKTRQLRTTLRENTSTTILKFFKNDTKAKKTRGHGLNMDSFYSFGWISRKMGYKKIYGFFRSWRVFAPGHFSSDRERKHVNYDFEIFKKLH